MKKEIVSLMIASLMAAIVLSASTFAAESSDTTRSGIMRSVAFVYMEVDGEMLAFSCFAINQDENGAHTFISAGSIARMAYTALYVGTKDNTAAAEIVYCDPDMDVVIIETNNPLPDCEIAEIDFEGARINTGANVYALGFNSLTETDEAAQGEITNPYVYRSNNTRLIQTTCEIDPLNVGGPMVSDGVVIGVNLLNLDGSGYAIPLGDIYNALYNDDTTTAINEPENGFFKQYGHWLMGAVAAMAAGIVWLLVKKNPQKKPDISTEATLFDSADPENPASSADPENPASPADSINEAESPLEPSRRPLKIVGTRGRYAYNGFLARKPIRFGKDTTQCDVVYPPETETIGAFHCEVVVEHDVTVLYDRGSALGTFLNGDRLEPGQAYPLAAGDLFYLGTTDNMFRVQ